MGKIIARCGLVCSECPAYIATQKDDDNERAKVAETWSKEFNASIKAEDINCDGCLATTGRLFNYCKVCEIRTCGVEKGLQNCAHCSSFACQKLCDFFTHAPAAQTNLEGIRKKL